MDKPIRLNKLLAEQLGISRREADELINSNRVLVNGAPAQLGTRVTRGVDLIAVDGKQLDSALSTFTYLKLNKPTGYVCSRRQQGDVPTIYELLPKEYRHLKPVGRLDKESSGLLLLTNDGDFAHQMTHPKFHKQKVYEVRLDKELSEQDFETITKQGVPLPDGPSKFSLDFINGQNFDWQITMSEGRNRQIRRTFAALGYTVRQLHRTRFGTFNLEKLTPGDFTQEVV